MENFPKKKRGRPRKIPESLVESLGVEVPKAPEVRELFGESMRTGRTRANRFYADGAREVIEAYAKQLKEHRVPIVDPRAPCEGAPGDGLETQAQDRAHRAWPHDGSG
jgi:hypothetical protein